VGGVELEDWENGLPCGDDNIDLVWPLVLQLKNQTDSLQLVAIRPSLTPSSLLQIHLLTRGKSLLLQVC
jgi:hypothetical protein